MRKKISFIELFDHGELVYVLLKLVQFSNYKIKVFTQSYIQEEITQLPKSDLDSNGIQWFTFSTSLSPQNFIKQNLTDINDSDLVIWTTLSSSFKFFSSLPLTTKQVLILHNYNSFFRPNHSLIFPFNITSFLKYCYYLFPMTNHYQKKLLGKMELLCLPEGVNFQPLKKNEGLAISPIPFTFYELEVSKLQRQKILITIPGTIDSNIRDYELVLKALKLISIPKNVFLEIQLLGIPKSERMKKIQEQFKAIESHSVEVKVYFNRIPIARYLDELRKTDFFILPFQVYKKHGVFKEYFGKTTISGTISDMVHYGIPSLIRTTYTLPPNVKQLTQAFSNKSELAFFIEKWVKERDYLRIRAKSHQLLEHYHFEKVRFRLITLIEDLLNV